MSAKTSGRRPPGPGMGGMEPKAAEDMMAVLLRAQSAMLDTMLRQNIETLGFLRRRFEKDRALLGTLAQAQDTGTAITAWSDFLSKAVADYSEEAARMAALAADAGVTLSGDEPGGPPGG